MSQNAWKEKEKKKKKKEEEQKNANANASAGPKRTLSFQVRAGPAQGIVRPKVATLSGVYSYILNISKRFV